jgi:polyhydroxybutyrate depolymerase
LRQYGAIALAATVLSCGVRETARYSGPEAWTSGTALHDVNVSGMTRDYLLHVPPRRPRSRLGIALPYPLVIALHGSGADGEAVRHASGLDAVADGRRFLVAYPNATRGTLRFFGADWNAGACCGAAARDDVNDVAFIKALIESVASHLPVDRRRVYVAGFSDGARMAYRMACANAASIAAIGVVAGSLLDPHCAPARPVPVIAFHGTDDTEVPYNDSALVAPRRPLTVALPPLPSSVVFWVAENSCRAVQARRESAHVVHTTVAPCAGGEVSFYSIDGGRHGWPGEPDGEGSKPPMTELRATDVMVRFLMRHQRAPGP